LILGLGVAIADENIFYHKEANEEENQEGKDYDKEECLNENDQ
jgi:hypothetical protein